MRFPRINRYLENIISSIPGILSTTITPYRLYWFCCSYCECEYWRFFFSQHQRLTKVFIVNEFVKRHLQIKNSTENAARVTQSWFCLIFDVIPCVWFFAITSDRYPSELSGMDCLSFSFFRSWSHPKLSFHRKLPVRISLCHSSSC